MQVTKEKMTMSLGAYSESFWIAAIPLKCEAILGKKWCIKHNTKIDYEKNIVQITHRLKQFVIQDIANSDWEISANSMELSRQGAQIFATALKPTDAGFNSNMRNDIKTLYISMRISSPKSYPMDSHLFGQVFPY